MTTREDEKKNQAEVLQRRRAGGLWRATLLTSPKENSMHQLCRLTGAFNFAVCAGVAQARTGIPPTATPPQLAGAYAGTSFGLNDVVFDADPSCACYGRQADNASSILDGQMQNPGSNMLGMVLGV